MMGTAVGVGTSSTEEHPRLVVRAGWWTVQSGRPPLLVYQTGNSMIIIPLLDTDGWVPRAEGRWQRGLAARLIATQSRMPPHSLPTLASTLPTLPAFRYAGPAHGHGSGGLHRRLCLLDHLLRLYGGHRPADCRGVDMKGGLKVKGGCKHEGRGENVRE